MLAAERPDQKQSIEQVVLPLRLQATPPVAGRSFSTGHAVVSE
jgi:hypothetical protein